MSPSSYDTFWQAWAAFRNNYSNVKTRWEHAFVSGDAAYAAWDCPCGLLSIGYLASGLEELCIAVRYLTDISQSSWGRSYFYKVIYYGGLYPELPDIPEEYELTWKKICEAWVKNNFEGKEWTIAIIDHMRKLMWDKPFRIIWASKPETE